MGERLAVFERGLDAWRRDDVEGVVGCIHPEAEITALRSATEGVYRGRDGMRDWFADSVDSFDVFEPQYGDIREFGDDGVVAIGTIHVRGAGSGLEMDIPSAVVMRFRDGLIHRWRDYGDRESALAATGLAA